MKTACLIDPFTVAITGDSIILNLAMLQPATVKHIGLFFWLSQWAKQVFKLDVRAGFLLGLKPARLEQKSPFVFVLLLYFSWFLTGRAINQNFETEQQPAEFPWIPNGWPVIKTQISTKLKSKLALFSVQLCPP